MLWLLAVAVSLLLLIWILEVIPSTAHCKTWGYPTCIVPKYITNKLEWLYLSLSVESVCSKKVAVPCNSNSRGAWLRLRSITVVHYLVIDYSPTRILLDTTDFLPMNDREREVWEWLVLQDEWGLKVLRWLTSDSHQYCCLSSAARMGGTESFAFRGTQAFPVHLVLPGSRGSQVTQGHLALGERLDNLDPQDHQESGLVWMPVRQFLTLATWARVGIFTIGVSFI